MTTLVSVAPLQQLPALIASTPPSEAFQAQPVHVLTDISIYLLKLTAKPAPISVSLAIQPTITVHYVQAPTSDRPLLLVHVLMDITMEVIQYVQHATTLARPVRQL